MGRPEGAINIIGAYGPASEDADEATLFFNTPTKWIEDAAPETPTIMGGDINVKLHDGDVEGGGARSPKDLKVQEILEEANMTSALRATRNFNGVFSYSKNRASEDAPLTAASLIDHFLVPTTCVEWVLGASLQDARAIRNTSDHKLLLMDYCNREKMSTPTYCEGMMVRPGFSSPKREGVDIFQAFLVETPEPKTGTPAPLSPIEQIKAYTTALLSLKPTTKWETAKTILSTIFDSFTSLYGDTLHRYGVAQNTSSRKVEKPKPLPEVPGEPLWNYLPGLQANQLRLYVELLQRDLLLTTNSAHTRQALTKLQQASAKVLEVLVDHLSSSPYHANQLKIAASLHQEVES